MYAVSKLVHDLTDDETTQLLVSLTWPGSECQKELRNRYGSQTAIALVCRDDGVVLSWVASREWRGLQTLEGFTRADSRRRGFAKLAAGILEADDRVTSSRETAVFNPDFIGVAASIGITRLRLYQLSNGDWKEVS